MFKHGLIIGMGMMGGSLAHAARKAGLIDVISGYNRNTETTHQALHLGLIDLVVTDLKNLPLDIDLIILGTPVSAFADIAKTIAPQLSEDVIVTDLGSVKQSVCDELSKHLPPEILVPAHPIAGSEKTGPANFVDDLFVNRWCILTPLAGTPIQKLDKLKIFWQKMGAMVEIMNPEDHDQALALTSHMPHFLSYGMVKMAGRMEEKFGPSVVQFSAGGFRDFTRLAGSDPTMWRDVFLANKDAVLNLINEYRHDLDDMEAMVKNNDGDALKALFEATRTLREAIIQAKQDESGRGHR